MKTYHTIIVEDDPMVASINRQYLQSNSMLQVIGEFRNGKEAVDFLEKQSADLAIVDYYMPVMDGRQFILACREKDISIDIIMITAANNAQEIAGILQLGIIDYLVKPFTFDRFSQAIDKYLGMKKVLRPDATLSQQELDRIMSLQSVPNPQQLLEKGLQEQTLELIRKHLAERPGVFLSSNEIAEMVHLSRITVRRYMNYLLENHEIVSQIDYSTGGRPSIKYRKS